jgi:hypothetical protein
LQVDQSHGLYVGLADVSGKCQHRESQKNRKGQKSCFRASS